jgi:phosphonate transport system permease protein
VYAFGRGFLSLLRTIPDLILATLLVAAFGIGPVAGVLALIVFTFGVVAKLLTDTVRRLTPARSKRSRRRAARGFSGQSSPCSRRSRPTTSPTRCTPLKSTCARARCWAWSGAGGVGVVLNEAINLFRTGRVGLIIAITFAAVFVIDSLSTWLRSKLV